MSNFSVLPVRLKTADEIAKTFKVSRHTVFKWKEAKAPIFKVGRGLQADYYELSKWLNSKV